MKSSETYLPDPPGTGKEFTYKWNKYVPPNQPYSGWVMIEARFSDNTKFYKSGKAAFTVQCIPHIEVVGAK